jgi:hypothetical protein
VQDCPCADMQVYMLRWCRVCVSVHTCARWYSPTQSGARALGCPCDPLLLQVLPCPGCSLLL